jgi:molybdopterin molybdotransferase/putative molybdopterin biosynthesis protein
VLVHGMKVTRGRVMGFGVIRGKLILILPGPIQGAVNAFALVAYPLIRALQGRGFELPPSIPAMMGNDWDAGPRFRDFTKVVYVKINLTGGEVEAEASLGETERVTFLTQNDGFFLAGEPVVFVGKGERVRVHLLPGVSSLA